MFTFSNAKCTNDPSCSHCNRYPRADGSESDEFTIDNEAIQAVERELVRRRSQMCDLCVRIETDQVVSPFPR